MKYNPRCQIRPCLCFKVARVFFPCSKLRDLDPIRIQICRNPMDPHILTVYRTSSVIINVMCYYQHHYHYYHFLSYSGLKCGPTDSLVLRCLIQEKTPHIHCLIISWSVTLLWSRDRSNQLESTKKNWTCSYLLYVMALCDGEKESK